MGTKMNYLACHVYSMSIEVCFTQFLLLVVSSAQQLLQKAAQDSSAKGGSIPSRTRWMLLASKLTSISTPTTYGLAPSARNMESSLSELSWRQRASKCQGSELPCDDPWTSWLLGWWRLSTPRQPTSYCHLLQPFVLLLHTVIKQSLLDPSHHQNLPIQRLTISWPL